MKQPYKIKCFWLSVTHLSTKRCTHSTKDRRPEWRYTITNTDTGETWAGTVA